MHSIKYELLLISLAIIAGLIDSVVLSTVYVSFVSSNLRPTCDARPSSEGITHFASLPMRGDDSPYQPVQLPFRFHLFGYLHDGLFITPNGALQMESAIPFNGPFGTSGFSLGGNPFIDNYYNLIAGLLTDLDPSESISPNANITYFVPTTENLIQVCYKDINFFGYDYKNSFDILVFNDSSIEIQYLKLKVKNKEYSRKYYEKYGVVPYNISGLRAPKVPHSKFTNEQLLIGKSIWNTPIPGVYPRYDYYDDNYRFVACPISSVWCSKPREFVSPFTSPTNIITLSTVSLSCTSQIKFAVSLSTVKTANPLVLSTKPLTDQSLYSCITGINEIACDITSFLTGNTAGNTEYFIKLFWTTANKTDQPAYDFESVPVSDLSIYLRSSSSSYNANENCVVNSYGNTSCLSSDPCSICSGNYTCLDLPCDGSGASSDVPYKYPESQCINHTCADDEPYFTYKSTDFTKYGCCALGDLDCNGNCYGPAQIAHKENWTAILCATDPKYVDCTGLIVCTATGCIPAEKQFDACGVCGGSDKTGATCNNGITFHSGYPGGTDFYPVLLLNETYAVATVYMSITNRNATDLRIQVEVSGDILNAPTIYDYPSILTLSGPGQSIVVPITVSFETLKSGSAGAAYEQKQIIFKYSRPSIPSLPTLTFASNVYASAANCDSLSAKDIIIRCGSIPGCIYCSQYPAQRVLKANEVEEVEEVVGDGGGDEFHLNKRRRDKEGDIYADKQRGLFVSVVPVEETLLFPTEYPGVCVDGTNTLSCPTFDSSAAAAHSSNNVTNSITSFISILMLMVLLFFSAL